MSHAPGVDVADTQKRAAAIAALAEVESGMVLGLGTGSTVRYFLEGLGEALGRGELHALRGVPTSIETERMCGVLGIPTLDLSDGLTLDLAVDGADEVSADLNLIKGLGGALLREKIVAQASRRFVVIVDETKEVEILGQRAPVPVEVAQFAWRAHLSFFRSLAAEPRPRVGADGDLVVTDNGNHLIDLRFPRGISAPDDLEHALHARAGILETGLFLDMADRVFVGGNEGVAVRERSPG